MASQIAQTVFTRAPLSPGSRHRVITAGYGRAAVPTKSCPRLQTRGVNCAVAGSPALSLMGASMWQTVRWSIHEPPTLAPAGSPVTSRQHGRGRGRGGAVGTSCSVYVGGYGVSVETVRWAVAAACTVLLLKRDAGAKKQFWAGILALEAPRDVLYWAKGEYGLWVACIGLALKVFYTVPAELEYPLAVYLLLASLPAQAVSLRGSLGARVVATALALFVAYQYFSNTVRFSDAFNGEHLVNILLVVVTALACAWFLGLTVL